MREIKFRVWNKIKNRMEAVWSISWRAWDDDSINSVEVEFDDGTHILLEHEVELMQFTGLKDKNGKEIYEGDIVVRIARGKRDEEHETIDDIRYIFLTNAPLYDKTNYGDDYDVEVIGNIYENPELVK